MKLAVLLLLLATGVASADRPREARPGRKLRHVLVERFDRDGDGRLDPQERRRASRALHRLANRLGHGKRERLIRRFDRNGDGNLTPDEIPPRVRERLRRHDRDDDGWIENNELR